MGRGGLPRQNASGKFYCKIVLILSFAPSYSEFSPPININLNMLLDGLSKKRVRNAFFN